MSLSQSSSSSLSHLLSGSVQDIYSGSSLTAHAAPSRGAGRSAAAPPAKTQNLELAETFDQATGRGSPVPYDDIDRSVQGETYSPEGTWALSITKRDALPTRSLETTATIQLNRAKQEEEPVGWELSTMYASMSGQLMGSIDQDGISVRAFTGIQNIQYQGNHQISYSGEEDSTAHTVTLALPAAALTYKYQASSHGAAHILSTASKIDTISVGLETTYANGNIVSGAKLAKSWYLFRVAPVPTGETAQSQLMQYRSALRRGTLLTSLFGNTMGEIGANIHSRIGWRWFQDFALALKFSLAQGKIDIKAATNFFVYGHRIKCNVNEEANIAFSGRFGVWGDSNLNLETKLEANPVQLVFAGQMPVFTAKLNWDVPVAQDY